MRRDDVLGVIAVHPEGISLRELHNAFHRNVSGQGMRELLDELEADSLIVSSIRRRETGRPATVYALREGATLSPQARRVVEMVTKWRNVPVFVRRLVDDA